VSQAGDHASPTAARAPASSKRPGRISSCGLQSLILSLSRRCHENESEDGLTQGRTTLRRIRPEKAGVPSRAGSRRERDRCQASHGDQRRPHRRKPTWTRSSAPWRRLVRPSEPRISPRKGSGPIDTVHVRWGGRPPGPYRLCAGSAVGPDGSLRIRLPPCGGSIPRVTSKVTEGCRTLGRGSVFRDGCLPARHSMRRPNTWLGQPLPRLGGCPTLRRPERGGTANGSHRRESPVGQQPLMRNELYPVAAALNRSQKRDSVSPPEPEPGRTGSEVSSCQGWSIGGLPSSRSSWDGGETHLFRTRAIQVRDRSKRPLATATRPAADCRSFRNFRRARSGPGSPSAEPDG
jgi:hypothetical protein